MITKIKNTVPRTYVISDLKKEKLAGTFYQKKKKKKKQQNLKNPVGVIHQKLTKRLIYQA